MEGKLIKHLTIAINPCSALRKVFLMFDQAKTGFVQTDQFPKVLNEMGLGFEEEDLKNRIASVDLDGERLKN